MIWLLRCTTKSYITINKTIGTLFYRRYSTVDLNNCPSLPITLYKLYKCVVKYVDCGALVDVPN